MIKRIKKDIDNRDIFIENDIDIEGRTIHLFEDINNVSASKVIKGIQIMRRDNLDKPIDIFINSFGGCPYSSFAVYDFIRASKDVTIRTYCCGCAMSGGSIIFMAGDERYMFENSVFMFHSVSSIAEGKVFTDIKVEYDECHKIHSQLCDVYAAGTNKTKAQWNKLIEHKDLYYRKDKALELGIIDGIVETNK